MVCRSVKIRLFTLLGVGLLLCGAKSFAQIEFSISPSPVGSGARAAGMADAFVAIADDATAASWNPAGLVQLERPEISVVGSFNSTRDAFEAFMRPEAESLHRGNSLDLNFLSITYPLPVLVAGRNATLSLSYQQKYDFTRDFNLRLDRRIPEFDILSILKFGFEQEGSLSSITPALAFELTERFSVGVAVNIWRSSFFADNDWEQKVTVDTETTIGTGAPMFTHRTSVDKYENFEGENLVIGLLWALTDRWSIGMRYDSEFTGNVDFTTTTDGTNIIPPHSTHSEEREVAFPATIVVGVSYRHNDKLTLAADLSRTDWNHFYVKDAAGDKFSLVDGANLNDPDRHTEFDTTFTLRLGAEYVFIPDRPTNTLDYLWSLRAGLFYDQEPASGRSTFEFDSVGNGEPDNFYGFTLGLGLLAKQRVNIDLAYQFRYGNNVNSDRVQGLDGFTEDLIQQRFLLSTVVYF